MPYVYSLSSVSYSDNAGTEFEIEIKTTPAQTEDGEDEHTMLLNNSEYDEQRIKDMYQYLISASGEELYFDDDKGELLATVEYKYLDPTDGINGKDTVRFYSSNTDRKVIISLNGENIYKTKQIYLTQLLSNAESFLSGGEIVLTY